VYACVCTQICRQGDQLVFEGSNGKPTASKIRPANCVGGPDAYTIPYVRYCKRNPEANHLVWFASGVRNDHRRLSPVSAKTSIIIVDVVVKRRILTSTEEAFRCDWLGHIVTARAHEELSSDKSVVLFDKFARLMMPGFLVLISRREKNKIQTQIWPPPPLRDFSTGCKYGCDAGVLCGGHRCSPSKYVCTYVGSAPSL